MDLILIAINIPTPKLYTWDVSGSPNVPELVPPLTVKLQTNSFYDGVNTGNVTEKEDPASLAVEDQQAGHH